MMDVSVVVVAYNAEASIERCLRQILSQDISEGEWELLLIDGSSTDRTVPIVESLRADFPRLRICPNPARQIAAGRNVGLRESRFPFVAFTDADCLVPQGWLRRLCRGFRATKDQEPLLVGVGGGNIPPEHSSPFLEALGICLNSWLMSFGSVQGKTFDHPRPVRSLAGLNCLFEKRALLEQGGFDETLGNIAEDLDMCLRLGHSGGRLFYLPGVDVHHDLRPDLASWYQNMALYGRGRAMACSKHRMFLTPFFVLPTLFFLAFACLPIGLLFPVFLLPITYIPCIFWYAGFLAVINRRPDLAFHIVSILLTTHVAYASHLALECARRLFRGFSQHRKKSRSVTSLGKADANVMKGL